MKYSSQIVARLCWELYPEVENEIEAVETFKRVLEQRINRKHEIGIDSIKDIEMHSVVEMCRIELINKLRKAG